MKYDNIIPVQVGDKIYEVDEDLSHGVITHTVDRVGWVAQTDAIDAEGNVWSDSWSNEDFNKAYTDYRQAEAALACKKCIQAGKTMACVDHKAGYICEYWPYRELAIKGEKK
jgi:hypothetical protein